MLFINFLNTKVNSGEFYYKGKVGVYVYNADGVSMTRDEFLEKYEKLVNDKFEEINNFEYDYMGDTFFREALNIMEEGKDFVKTDKGLVMLNEPQKSPCDSYIGKAEFTEEQIREAFDVFVKDGWNYILTNWGRYD